MLRDRRLRRTVPLESLPGLGPILGTEFLVATGGELAGFASPDRLASYAGLVPVPQDSGRVSVHLRRQKRYNRRLRRVFYMAACPASRPKAPTESSTSATPRTVTAHPSPARRARRLVDVLWALLRDGRRFIATAPLPITSAA